MIRGASSSTAARFLDQQLAREHRLHWGDVPEPMRDPTTPPKDGWQGWTPLASTVTAESLAAFEPEIDVSLPGPFRELLARAHFLSLHAPKLAFCSHPPEWQAAKHRQQSIELLAEDGETLASPEALRLFVIGEHRDDGGPICLDLGSTAPDGDCRVVFVDHETGERTGTRVLVRRARDRAASRAPRWSSSTPS